MSVITPVILSGGFGTRLWPLSRPNLPKQMLRLVADETMLQLTALRVARGELFSAPIVVASASQAGRIEAQLAEANCEPARLILEPCPRNTAAAIAMAALTARPDELLLLLPSDHLVTDRDAFHLAVQAGLSSARQGWLVTFGLRPTRPDTGYGYIKGGAGIAPGVLQVERFVEKPSAAVAESYLADGGYDWNGGILLFQANTMLEELERHAPDILQQVRQALAAAAHEGCRLQPDAAAFSAVRSQSLDFAVLERAERVAVVSADFGWSDVGSWDALFELGSKNADGNVAQGDVIAIDSSNCLLRSQSRLIVAIGVENLIVVETADATLILPRGSSSRVQEAVNALRERSHPALDAWLPDEPATL